MNKDNIEILDKDNCTGCRMCEQICPAKAIHIQENKEGFIEPVVDNKICTNCGLCSSRCPQLNDVSSKRLKKIEAFAAKNIDKQEQIQSSSGGIFSVIANYVLENNGIVYGAAYNSNLEVEHIGIENKSELFKLRGSKYVQSNTKNTFTDVKKNLENDRLVLYTGTPCQIAGLKNFLGKEYENLILVDLVCHGVPSPKLFKKYVNWLEQKNKSKVKSYQFRNKKKFAWGSYGAEITFENNKIKYIAAPLDSYYKSFLEAKTFRNVCYKCKYATTNRLGDITLMDYWGIENQYPNFVDSKGVSAILVNTNKGKQIVKKLNKKMYLLKTTVMNVAKENRNLNSPSDRSKIRADVYKNIENLDYQKYAGKNLKFEKRIIDIIKNIVPKDVKQTLKKITEVKR